jgi:hypothetical protein
MFPKQNNIYINTSFIFGYIRLQVYQKMPSMTHSESVFNNSLVYPCMKATVFLLRNSLMAPHFFPGEEQLMAMTTQLTKMGTKVDHRKKYNADGVVRLIGLFDLEVLVIETSGCFKNQNERKIAFDNSKGMFTLLSMLKTVAGQFDYASVEQFKKHCAHH